MEQNGGSRCNNDDKRHILQYLHWGEGEYALVHVKHSNAIPEYSIMCIKVGECKYCSWTMEFQYLHMSICKCRYLMHWG